MFSTVPPAAVPPDVPPAAVPPATPAPAIAPSRRVRQQVRDAAAVVAFSAGASTCLALALLLLLRLAGS